MGIYLEGFQIDDEFSREALRQAAVDWALPLRFRDDTRLRDIARSAAEFYETAASAISIIDRKEQLFLAREGIEDWGTPREVSFCAVAIQTPGEPLVVRDAREDARFRDNPVVTGKPHVRFYAGVSIVDVNGYPLGAMCVFDPMPRAQGINIAMLAMLTREVERVVCT